MTALFLVFIIYRFISYLVVKILPSNDIRYLFLLLLFLKTTPILTCLELRLSFGKTQVQRVLTNFNPLGKILIIFDTSVSIDRKLKF